VSIALSLRRCPGKSMPPDEHTGKEDRLVNGEVRILLRDELAVTGEE
jgi:hypothetical protein